MNRVGMVREVNKSGTAATALKTRFLSIYNAAPFRGAARPRGARLHPEGSRTKFLAELRARPFGAKFACYMWEGYTNGTQARGRRTQFFTHPGEFSVREAKKSIHQLPAYEMPENSSGLIHPD